MDSPLNKAHQCSRKADALTAAGKYQDAISCHNRASEHILDTLQSPVLCENPSLMSCLRQQHEHHLRQVKILHGRQLRCANLEARRSRSAVMHSKEVQTEVPSKNRGDVGQDNVLVNTQNIEESIREADSMLQFLRHRTEEDSNLEVSRFTRIYAPVDNGGPSDVHGADKRMPKDDKVIMEELRCLTGELYAHITKLVQENGWLKSQTQELEQKFKESKRLSAAAGEERERGVGEDSDDELVAVTSHFSLSCHTTSSPSSPTPFFQGGTTQTPVTQCLSKLSTDSGEDFIY